MSKRKSTKGLSAILSSLIILLVVVTVVGFLFIFTNDFTTDLKTFYVKNGQDTIMSDRDSYEIIVGQTYQFDIVNNLDSISNTNSGYNVKIVPSSDVRARFDFKVNDAVCGYSYLDSLSKGFDIKTYSTYFTLTANNDLQQILEEYYPNKTITGCPTAIDSEIPYFTLVVSSADNSQTINITFNLKSE